ncbi:MAG TPA: helix-turn-helix domain-containing protein [Actinotalea sp.]|nr:helix-turn-helix domain-containing protein [Actinotalea sp.]
MSTKLPKGSRITGEGRSELAASLVERYSRGESIRSMAQDLGRSYGFVHGVLVESGVSMRSRGGATRGPAAEARRAALRVDA